MHFIFNSYSDNFIIFDNNKDFNEWLCFVIKNIENEFHPHFLIYSDEVIIVSNNKIVNDLNLKKLFIDSQIKSLLMIT